MLVPLRSESTRLIHNSRYPMTKYQGVSRSINRGGGKQCNVKAPANHLIFANYLILANHLMFANHLIFANHSIFANHVIFAIFAIFSNYQSCSCGNFVVKEQSLERIRNGDRWEHFENKKKCKHKSYWCLPEVYGGWQGPTRWHSADESISTAKEITNHCLTHTHVFTYTICIHYHYEIKKSLLL